jgi:hypothetical protein
VIVDSNGMMLLVVAMLIKKQHANQLNITGLENQHVTAYATLFPTAFATLRL